MPPKTPVRRRFSVLAGMIALMLTLAACGGPGHHRRQVRIGHGTATRVRLATGHRCNPKDAVMQCLLPPAPTTLGAPRSAFAPLSGIDFGWSCPSGRNFGASYLSYDTGKDWSASCLASYHAAGKGAVVVFEAGANDAQGGYSTGRTEALHAVALLSVLHVPNPAGQPIDMAIDCDCAGSTLASYFQGANSVHPHLIGAYGGYYQLLYLSQLHLLDGRSWQTYAWSGGRWLPPSIAPLEQYLNDSSVDYDRAIAPDYGQLRYAPPKPPGPSPTQIKQWTSARDSALRTYRHARCLYPVLVGPNLCHTNAAAVIANQVKLDTVAHRPVCWGPHAQLKAPVCQIVRPQLSVWSRARQSSYKVARAKGCYGPSGQSPRSTPGCRGLFGRAEYFNHKAEALFKAWD